MSENFSKREEVRSLVKEVLQNVASAERESDTFLPPRNIFHEKIEEKEFDRDESAKVLLTEDDFRGLENGASVRIAEDAKLTPLANDLVNEKHLNLIRKVPREATLKVKRIGIGCDHGGFETKQRLIDFLKKELGLLVRDYGTNSTESVDYPDYAHEVAQAVSDGLIEAGIMIDGAGIGSAMAAGKVSGVRPAACYNIALARNSREHNGANFLSLGSGQNSFAEIKEIVYTFLTTEITEPRHKTRVAKIEAIEKQYKR